VPIRIFKKDGGVIGASASMLYLGQRYLINKVEFEEQTREFERNIGKGVYVYVNGVTASEPLAEVTRYDFEEFQKKAPDSVFIEVQGAEGLAEKLTEITAMRGPIAGVKIYGHGTPGRISLGGRFETAISFRDALEARMDEIRMVPDATVAFVSCELANSLSGEYVLDAIGDTLLKKNGGTVFGSEVTIWDNRDVLREMTGSEAVAGVVGATLDVAMPLRVGPREYLRIFRETDTSFEEQVKRVDVPPASESKADLQDLLRSLRQ